MNKETKETKIEENKQLPQIGSFIPRGLDELFPPNKDEINIVVEKCRLEQESKSIYLTIGTTEYRSTSAVLYRQLNDAIMAGMGKPPFKATLKRKEGENGKYYLFE